MKHFNQPKSPETLLYLSFDTQLEVNESRQLDQALAHSSDLRDERESIIQLRQSIHQSAVHQFDPFFASRVMQKIYTISRATEDFFTSLVWSFRRVAIPGLTCLILLVGHNFIQTGKINAETFLSLPQLTLEETWTLEDLLEGETK